MTRLLLALALLGMAAAGCTSNEAGSAAPASTSTTVDSSTTSITAVTSTAEPTVTAEPPPEPVPVETTVYRETARPYTAPAVPMVVLGEQCFSRGETAATSDGSTAYCSRQAGWGKNIWSLNPTLAPNPELQESTQDTAALGGICYDDSATTTDAEGRALYCNPKVDGEYPGTVLFWYLVP